MAQRNTFRSLRSVIVLFAVMAVLGCSFTQGLLPKGTDQPSPNPEDTITVDPQDEDIDVRIMDEGYEPEPFEYARLGSISFQQDAESSKTIDVTSKEPAELQVTDAAGVTWTLSIPAGAFDSDQTIRMTALTDLESGDINGLASGIALEPDGIEFLRPVELRVNGSKLNAHTLIFSGDKTGNAVEFAMQDPTADEPQARITHFSTYFATNSSEEEFFDRWYKWSSEEYRKAAQEAKKLLKEEIRVPEPPSIPLECPDDGEAEKNGPKLKAYVEKVRQPEAAMLGRLVSMKRMMVMTAPNPEELEQITNLEIRLVYRQLKKAKMLMDQYYGSEDKVLAVAEVVVSAIREVQLLDSGQPNDENVSNMLTELSKWYDGLIDDLLNDLVSNHNYKKIPLVIEMYRRAALLGGQDNRSEELIERMQKALKFEVQIHVDLHYPEESYITDATVKVQFDLDSLSQCSGSGTGSYTSITSPHAQVDVSPYPVQVVVKDFDPCNGKVTVGFDRFGAASEIYTIDPDDDEPLVQDMPLVQNAGEALYADHAGAGMYLFEMQVDNGNPVTGEETFDGSKYGKLSAEVTVKLVHTPE